MCFMFGCCRDRTLSVFDDTDGHRLRRTLRETSAAVNIDDRMLPWGAADILIAGREQPSSTSTNEGQLMLRDKDTLLAGTLSVSTPLTSQIVQNNDGGSILWMQGDSTDGVWLWRSGQGINYFNTDLEQQWTFATATGSGLVRSGTDVILTKSSVSGASTIIEKIDNTGASVATLAVNALSVTASYTIGTCSAFPIADSGNILVYGRETRTSFPTKRRLWIVDSSLTEIAANSPVDSATTYTAKTAFYNNTMFVSPDESSAVLRLSTTSLVRIDLATLTEDWTVTAGDVVRCCDDTNVYTEETGPTARSWADGSVVWDGVLEIGAVDNMKIAEETGKVICLSMNRGAPLDGLPCVAILEPADGSVQFGLEGKTYTDGNFMQDVLNYDGKYYISYRQCG